MIDKILILLALICFFAAAVGIPSKINLGWLGAFLLTLTLVI